MAGDVFGSGRLPLDPSYRFQILASARRHAILRDYGPAAPPRDSSAANLEVFWAMHFEEVTRQPRPVGTGSLVPEALSGVWPLTARVQAPAHDGSIWLLEFPVNHLNHRDAGHVVEFQIETGPVLIPAVLVETTGVTVLDGFCLAYVFFNSARSRRTCTVRLGYVRRHAEPGVRGLRAHRERDNKAAWPAELTTMVLEVDAVRLHRRQARAVGVWLFEPGETRFTRGR